MAAYKAKVCVETAVPWKVQVDGMVLRVDSMPKSMDPHWNFATRNPLVIPLSHAHLIPCRSLPESAIHTLRRAEFSHCPNCHGASTLIAVRNCTDANDVTQVDGNRTAENHLEAQTEHHTISTPAEAGTQRVIWLIWLIFRLCLYRRIRLRGSR